MQVGNGLLDTSGACCPCWCILLRAVGRNFPFRLRTAWSVLSCKLAKRRSQKSRDLRIRNGMCAASWLLFGCYHNQNQVTQSRTLRSDAMLMLGKMPRFPRSTTLTRACVFCQGRRADSWTHVNWEGLGSFPLKQSRTLKSKAMLMLGEMPRFPRFHYTDACLCILPRTAGRFLDPCQLRRAWSLPINTIANA